MYALYTALLCLQKPLALHVFLFLLQLGNTFPGVIQSIFHTKVSEESVFYAAGELEDELEMDLDAGPGAEGLLSAVAVSPPALHRSIANSDAGPTPPSKPSSASPERVRTKFPETWIWSDVLSSG